LIEEYGELFVPSFSDHCSTSLLHTDLIWTETINILTTTCIQFDERFASRFITSPSPLCRKAPNATGPGGQWKPLKSHPCAMKLAVEMIHTFFLLPVHCDFKKILIRGNSEWACLPCTWQRTTLANYL
jgi:hypothetical protein